MKRNIEVLMESEEAIRDYISRIEEWLEHKDSDACPFSGSGFFGCECTSLFPGLQFNSCPCDDYSREYVIKVAREILEKLKK